MHSSPNIWRSTVQYFCSKFELTKKGRYKEFRVAKLLWKRVKCYCISDKFTGFRGRRLKKFFFGVKSKFFPTRGHSEIFSEKSVPPKLSPKSPLMILSVDERLDQLPLDFWMHLAHPSDVGPTYGQVGATRTLCVACLR